MLSVPQVHPHNQERSATFVWKLGSGRSSTGEAVVMKCKAWIYRRHNSPKTIVAVDRDSGSVAANARRKSSTSPNPCSHVVAASLISQTLDLTQPERPYVLYSPVFSVHR